MTPTRKDSVGIIYIETKLDDKDQFERVQKELDQTIRYDYRIFKINGDEIPDLSVCLNLGIRSCIESGVEFIHWCHPDFYYDDPNWYDTLKNILNSYPEILKICASNSRDQIHPLRIGQEQSFLFRTQDFIKYPWLWFDERYKNIGGTEDWTQSLNILGRGYLVCITPGATIFHLGAQTRSKKDTNPDQLYNQQVFGEITGFGQLVEVHDLKYFGCLLSKNEYEFVLANLSPTLVKALNLPKNQDNLFKGSPEMKRDIFPAFNATQTQKRKQEDVTRI